MPEAVAWRAEREERQQAVRQAEMAELGRQYQALGVCRIDPFAESAEKPKPLPNWESSS